jgi:hypothetical protein
VCLACTRAILRARRRESVEQSPLTTGTDVPAAGLCAPPHRLAWLLKTASARLTGVRRIARRPEILMSIVVFIFLGLSACSTSPEGPSESAGTGVMLYFGSGVIAAVIAGSLSNPIAATRDRGTPHRERARCDHGGGRAARHSHVLFRQRRYRPRDPV